MLVCHCFAVRSREIDELVARGARSVAEIARTCGAGNGCGGCRPLIAELLEGGAPTPGTQNFRAGERACAHNALR